jgi:16S rRNA (guanine527-N7)-methyltransferase
MLDASGIAALLHPFADVSDELANNLRTYLDLLLRWNARMNLTAVRDPEEIVTRHFGESLFAARVLREAGAFRSATGQTPTLSDIGSGAGFPGIPIKLAEPQIHLTLIESQNKKATFLREVIRTVQLSGVEVFCGRAEAWNRQADMVTLRAIEKFNRVLPVAAKVVAPSGTLALLVGKEQAPAAQLLLGPQWCFRKPVAIPLSQGRIILVGKVS